MFEVSRSLEKKFAPSLVLLPAKRVPAIILEDPPPPQISKVTSRPRNMSSTLSSRQPPQQDHALRFDVLLERTRVFVLSIWGRHEGEFGCRLKLVERSRGGGGGVATSR